MRPGFESPWGRHFIRGLYRALDLADPGELTGEDLAAVNFPLCRDTADVELQASIIDQYTRDGNVLAKLLLIWGIAATVANIIAGRLIGKVGSRRIINSAILGAVQLAASNCYWLCVRGLV
jgi:hypothetical protein